MNACVLLEAMGCSCSRPKSMDVARIEERGALGSCSGGGGLKVHDSTTPFP